jgi:hypothetical protein
MAATSTSSTTRKRTRRPATPRKATVNKPVVHVERTVSLFPTAQRTEKQPRERFALKVVGDEVKVCRQDAETRYNGSTGKSTPTGEWDPDSCDEVYTFKVADFVAAAELLEEETKAK